MTTTTAQQTALEQPSVPIAYFVEFQFRDATSRVCNFTQTFTWNGFDWAGLGAIGAISEVVESSSPGAKALNFTLNISDPSILALAIGPAEQYRGRRARMWMCPLNENYQLIDTPVLCWRGTMEDMSLGVDKDKGSIQLKCETIPPGMRKSLSLRLNSAQQKKRHPTDTGFDKLNEITSGSFTWLSKRFQEI